MPIGSVGGSESLEHWEVLHVDGEKLGIKFLDVCSDDEVGDIDARMRAEIMPSKCAGGFRNRLGNLSPRQ